MLSTEEKLIEFKKSIRRETERETARINSDIESYRHAQMEALEDEVLSECYRTIQAAVAQIRMEYTTQRSQALSEMRRHLLRQRDKYAGAVFEKAKEKLIAFTSSADYPKWLEKKLSAAAKEYRMRKPVLYVREADLPLQAALEKILPGCEVRVDREITIGGFVIEEPELSYVINESLDSILSEQKEWFFSNSGLRVTQL